MLSRVSLVQGFPYTLCMHFSSRSHREGKTCASLSSLPERRPCGIITLWIQGQYVSPLGILPELYVTCVSIVGWDPNQPAVLKAPQQSIICALLWRPVTFVSLELHASVTDGFGDWSLDVVAASTWKQPLEFCPYTSPTRLPKTPFCFRMGNTCTPMADSCRCMAETTTVL